MSKKSKRVQFDLDDRSLLSIQENVELFAKQGLTISFAYGPCGDKGVFWSVDVLTPEGNMFDKPFLANSLEHAVQIAFAECIARQWFDLHKILSIEGK